MKTISLKLDTEMMARTIECLDIAEAVKSELTKSGTAIPEKFVLCEKAATKMLADQPVNREELQGLLDSVGGFYLAMKCLDETHKQASPGSMKRARVLCDFAIKLQNMTAGEFGLTLIDGGKL